MPSSKIVVLSSRAPLITKARKPKRFVYVLMQGDWPLAAYDTRRAAERAASRFNLWDCAVMRVSVDPLRIAR